MNIPALIPTDTLPTLIDRATSALENARTSAEVLEARDLARVAYDAAKSAARLAKAKGAYVTLIAAVHRAQADALEIEAQAKRRLADEYDAAQERGEVKANGGDRVSTVAKQNSAPSVTDIGLSRKAVHEARIVRDAEASDPGIVRRTLDEVLDAGEEPTRAKVKRAVREVVGKATPAPKAGAEAICALVRDAINSLSGLPPAKEVATYFRNCDAASLLATKLPSVREWIGDLSKELGGSEDA